MRKILVLAVMCLATVLTGCGFVQTGEVGVRTQYGKVKPTPEQPGFYTAVLSHIDLYTVKETAVELTKLTPRAKDNLTLRDLDVTVYYKANPEKIPGFVASRAGMSAKSEGGFYLPGYNLVDNEARGVIQDAVSKFDSLTLHQNRVALEDTVKSSLQTALNARDPGMFEVTRVVVKTVQTDPAVEEAIRKSIQVQKDIETATKQVQVKNQEALANESLSKSLTPAYLQHEYNQAITECARRQGCTLIIGNATPILNLNR